MNIPRFLVTLTFLGPSLCLAGTVKALRLKDNTVSTVSISHRGAVLSFPMKPSKVVIGNKGAFAVEYINNDLAISPLRSDARAHVFVYVGGKRFNLDIVTSSQGHTLVEISDASSAQVEIPYVK